MGVVIFFAVLFGGLIGSLREPGLDEPADKENNRDD